MTSLRAKMKQEMELRGLAQGTQKLYLKAIIQLFDYYQRSPAKLNEEEIKAFLSHLGSKALAPSSYNVLIHGLRFFYRTVLKKEATVPVLLPRKIGQQKLPDILSLTEVKKIIQATSNLRNRTLLIITYGAGLRASEVAKLQVGDIDSDRMMLHIRNGKGGKDRYTPLSNVMLKSLRHYWREVRSRQNKNSKSQSNTHRNAFLFLNQSGKPLSPASCTAIYKQAKQAAGITKQGGIHGLRHAFAIHALETGTDLYVIKQLLGHASITTTVRYVRMTSKNFQSFKPPIEQLAL